MPTPIEILLDPISLIIIVMFFGLMLWETLLPGRKLQHVKGWTIKGIVSFAIYFYLSSYLPIIIDPYLAEYQFFDLSGLGTIGGFFVGLLVFEFCLYVWHYAMHKSDILWRVFHQMHHSAERLDVAGSFYFSLMDIIGLTVIGSLSLTLIVGISPAAITAFLLFTALLGIFQHTNIKTPHWLGYIVQRPESHTYHHAKGIHKHNYADIVIFDQIFGTFLNPKGYEYETGFYDGASDKVIEMLTFQDINKNVRGLENVSAE
tara:strand:- start:108661 stop:109440 length:780 start_codon:yes stop_codon:yes gene_type:complete